MLQVRITDLSDPPLSAFLYQIIQFPQNSDHQELKLHLWVYKQKHP